MLRGSDDSKFVDVTAVQLRSETGKEGRENARSGKSSDQIDFGVRHSLTGTSVSAGVKLEHEETESFKAHEDTETAYSKILLRSIELTPRLRKLDELLRPLGINRLYIFVDDFSELPAEAMEIFVDSILAPLNNWSNELIKFKVAAYPNRIYLGKIDRTKIDEIYLDMYKLYGTGDVPTMEEKAIEFTERLLSTRIKEYCGVDASSFVDLRSKSIYRSFFNATMGNPRNLGHILHYLYETNIVYGRSINARSISEASIKYFEEKVEPFFGVQQFRQLSFDERSSIFSLKELLKSIVNKSRGLRSYTRSAVMKRVSGRPPTSHFHIISEFDSILSTFELNFFITKYFEMKDRDGRKVSVYALNFGLCAKQSISFGRPEGEREFRLYFVERIFDYTPVLQEYLTAHQEIRCDNAGCGAIHGLDKLESIRTFGMLCPTCRKGSCHITNLSKKYATMLNGINVELLLPAIELGILETLYTERRKMAASDIAAELDCSYQLIGKRGKIMDDRGLVVRSGNNQNRRFELSDRAEGNYFARNTARHLELDETTD